MHLFVTNCKVKVQLWQMQSPAEWAVDVDESPVGLFPRLVRRVPAVRSQTGLRTGLWSGPRLVWSAVAAELGTEPAVWSLVLAAWDRWCWSQTGLNQTGPLVG
jgi:hypothetical protein